MVYWRLLECGISCPAIALAECAQDYAYEEDYEEDAASKTECFAPQVSHFRNSLILPKSSFYLFV